MSNHWLVDESTLHNLIAQNERMRALIETIVEMEVVLDTNEYDMDLWSIQKGRCEMLSDIKEKIAEFDAWREKEGFN